MGKSSIEWTDETDNIIVVEGGGWWCRKCSEGCDNCYAEGVNASNYFKGNHLKYTGSAPKLRLREDIVDGWRRQTRPRKHFVASMTDVFGEWVENRWIYRFLDGMAAAPRQTFQVLTKRSRRMRETVAEWLVRRGLERVPANIWLGISVENQKWADIRIPDLLSIPATRFLSCEPLLGSVDIDKYLWDPGLSRMWIQDLIHWIIVGGESGKNARPMNPDWARTLRDQCVAAGVPFFFKQWGEWIDVREFLCANGQDIPCVEACDIEGVHYWRVGKKRAGRVLDGRTWDEFPKAEVLA